MYRIIAAISALLVFISLFFAVPVFAERLIISEPFALNTGNIVNPDAKPVTETLRDLGDTMIVQRDEADRKKEEKQEETDRRKNAEEDARLAPTCDPLKSRVLSLLNSAGTEPRSFNQALSTLRDIEKQLPSSCPKKIQIFGSSIVNIVPCYNEAMMVELADGGRFVLTKETRTFKYGPPKAKDERIMGLTDNFYYCIASVSPLKVWAAVHIGAMASRSYDAGDRDFVNADRIRARARAAAALDGEIEELDRKILRDPRDAASFEARGNVYQKKGDHLRAIADFDKLSVLQPSKASAWNYRCWARAIANRELPQALADCTESLKLEPNEANTLDSRGFAHLRIGEFNKSIADYDAALKLNSALAPSLYGRGLAKRMKGNRAGGDVDIAAAKKINANIADEFARYGIK